MKTFQLEIDDGPDTRWLYTDKDLAEILRYLAVTIVTAHTTGAKPAVSVKTVRPAQHETALAGR